MKLIDSPIDSPSLSNILYSLAFFAIFIVLIFFLSKSIYSSDTFFLVNHDQGIWIRSRQPVVLQIKDAKEIEHQYFRHYFSVGSGPLQRDAELIFRSFRSAAVFLDNKCIFENPGISRKWNRSYTIRLDPNLTAGPHCIVFDVSNVAAPPALTASCTALGIQTNEHWEVSSDGIHWEKAFPAATTVPPEIYASFQNSLRPFVSIIPEMLTLLSVGLLAIVLTRTYPKTGKIVHSFPLAQTARWFALGMYLVLAVNNFFKLPVYLGMDYRGHMEYIEYIANNLRIPLASEGWSMCEPPLFYVLSSFFYRIFLNLLPLDFLYRTLRVIPLVCGALQIELCFRTVKAVYPERDDLQAVGTLIGSFIPTSIFVSQFIGTEPFAACLSSAVVLLSYQLIHAGTQSKTRTYLYMGLFLGLSILSKITAVLLIPPLLIVIAVDSFKWNRNLREAVTRAVKNSSTVLGIAFLVSGWFFIRNYLELGKPIITNTSYWGDALGSISYWQDPGYRTLNQLSLTLQSVLHPIYAGLFSFWDSLYSSFWVDGWLSGQTVFSQSPPWNYDYMQGGIWFSLLPFTLIVLGMAGLFKTRAENLRESILFSTLCILVLVGASLYQFLQNPNYSAVKGKYLLGILPCFAVLSAAGYDLLTRSGVRILKYSVLGLLICWISCVFLSYFVTDVSDEIFMVDRYKLAQDLIDRGRLLDAADEYIAMHQRTSSDMGVEPEFLRSLNKQVEYHVRNGDTVTALNYLMRLKDLQPDNPSHYYNIACLYAQENRLDESIKWLRLAITKGFRDHYLLKNDPDLKNIRNTPLFTEIYRELGQ